MRTSLHEAGLRLNTIPAPITGWLMSVNEKLMLITADIVRSSKPVFAESDTHTQKVPVVQQGSGGKYCQGHLHDFYSKQNQAFLILTALDALDATTQQQVEEPHRLQAGFPSTKIASCRVLGWMRSKVWIHQLSLYLPGECGSPWETVIGNPWGKWALWLN